MGSYGRGTALELRLGAAAGLAHGDVRSIRMNPMNRRRFMQLVGIGAIGVAGATALSSCGSSGSGGPEIHFTFIWTWNDVFTALLYLTPHPGVPSANGY